MSTQNTRKDPTASDVAARQAMHTATGTAGTTGMTRGSIAQPCGGAAGQAEDLLAYLRDELPVAARWQVENHLRAEGCRPCNGALLQMRQLEELFASPELQPSDPSPELFSRILASIAQEESQAARPAETSRERAAALEQRALPIIAARDRRLGAGGHLD